MSDIGPTGVTTADSATGPGRPGSSRDGFEDESASGEAGTPCPRLGAYLGS